MWHMQLSEGSTLSLWVSSVVACMTSVRTQSFEFGGVDCGVDGVVFSLTWLN